MKLSSYFEPMACYDAEYDIMAVHVSRIEGEQDIVQGKVFIGSEENLRQFFADKGKSPEEIEKALAENAAKVEALGLNPEKVHGQGYEEYMLEEDREAYEDYMEKNNEDYEEEEDIEEERSEVALESGDEDCMDILNGTNTGENVEEESKVKEEANTDDLYEFMAANNDAKGLVDDAPVKSEADVSDILEELGGDDMSLG